jgi:hypothetical protein
MAIRYQAQTDVYWFVVSDRYPYSSPALQPPPEPEPEWGSAPEPLVEPI